MPRKPKCCCDDPHPINESRKGIPLAMWTCPIHGNLFEERGPDYVPPLPPLTWIENRVIAAMRSEIEAGRTPSADSISSLTNHTLSRVEKAMTILKAHWKKIDSAPKDGRHVLLAANNDPPAWVAEGYFEEGHGWYASNVHWTDAHANELHPTHWMHIPRPPKNT